MTNAIVSIFVPTPVLYYPRAPLESLLTWSGMPSASLLAWSTSRTQQHLTRVDKLHRLVHLRVDAALVRKFDGESRLQLQL